jgi:hypothetical protein
VNWRDREYVTKSLLERMWEELDSIVERLVAEAESEDGQDRGRAEGVAYCIALITMPYAPSLDRIRQLAMERQAGSTSLVPDS